MFHGRGIFFYPSHVDQRLNYGGYLSLLSIKRIALSIFTYGMKEPAGMALHPVGYLILFFVPLLIMYLMFGNCPMRLKWLSCQDWCCPLTASNLMERLQLYGAVLLLNERKENGGEKRRKLCRRYFAFPWRVSISFMQKVALQFKELPCKTRFCFIWIILFEWQ